MKLHMKFYAFLLALCIFGHSVYELIQDRGLEGILTNPVITLCAGWLVGYYTRMVEK